jgi:hypothetical protein
VPGALVFAVDVPLAGLASGAYELALTATAKSAKPVTRAVTITVK